MGYRGRPNSLMWVASLIFLLFAVSAVCAGAKDTTKDKDGDEDSSKRVESLLRQVLEENRALRQENAEFRASQLQLLEELNEIKGVVKSFEERLAAFSSFDQNKQSKWSLTDGLPDGFKPAAAEPLLDPGSPRTDS